jgi:hypothetical protein
VVETERGSETKGFSFASARPQTYREKLEPVVLEGRKK